MKTVVLNDRAGGQYLLVGLNSFHLVVRKKVGFTILSISLTYKGISVGQSTAIPDQIVISDGGGLEHNLEVGFSPKISRWNIISKLQRRPNT